MLGCAGAARGRGPTSPASLPGSALPYDAIQALVEAGDPQAALEVYDQAVRGGRPNLRSGCCGCSFFWQRAGVRRHAGSWSS